MKFTFISYKKQEHNLNTNEMKKIIKYLCLFFSYFFVLSPSLRAQHEELTIPLSDDSGLTIEGPHRFVEIAGITGLQVTSLKTKAFAKTTALNSAKGSVSFWMSPLENMDKSQAVGSSKDKMKYPFLADKFPLYNTDSCNFSVFYWGAYYPRVVGRFTQGSFWGQMDYGLAPFVYAEDLPLQKRQWYHFVITWNKPAEILVIYVNGQMVGHNYSAKDFMEANERLYIGNPLMVISRLKIQNQVLTHDQVKKEYVALRPATNGPSDETIRRISTPQDKPALDVKLDDDWKKIYECKFNQPSDLDAWKFQTGDLFYDKFKLEVADQGLYWATPGTIHTETRGYLWCPVKLEGDCWVEYEFQLVSPKGLSLLIVYASGMQGEDVIEEYGLRKTGSMGDMLSNYRNYHWEYMRRVEAMRTDVETQYVNKNPWGKSIYVGCVPRFEQNRWYKIRFVKIGNRLHGSLDGKTVFDVTDNLNNNGPIFSSGRVVLRQMYHTEMRYRNFTIYRKKSF